MEIKKKNFLNYFNWNVWEATRRPGRFASILNKQLIQFEQNQIRVIFIASSWKNKQIFHLEF